MPYQNERIRSANSDKNQALLDRIALSVYLDMGKISQEQYDEAIGTPQTQIDLLQSIPDLSGSESVSFSGRFIIKIVSEDESYLDLVPPATLARAYSGLKEQLADNSYSESDHDHFKYLLEKVTNRIDWLISDFALNIGYHFADTTNIADVYSGYNEMFDVREADLDQTNDSYLLRQIADNRNALESYITEYDRVNGISGINEESNVASIERNYDAAVKRANNWTPSDDTLEKASKYKFLDEQGAEIPQFVSEAGIAVADYQPGAKVDENGRLAAVIDLTRHDYALHHVADNATDNQDVQQDLDEGLLFKLFEIDTAEKIVSGVVEDPTRFTDPAHFQQFVQGLQNGGGSISEAGYEAAMDAQVNKTAGFAQRIKQKLKGAAQKATGFFQKVFEPIRAIDKRAKDRFSKDADKRQKRIEFFVRILKGFGSAFLMSAAITTIATAAAALSGVSLAVSLAAIGTTIAIVASSIQVYKWRQAQKEQDKPATVKALLQDKRMVATLGTSLLAVCAMCFGAAGLKEAAIALGYSALAVGGSTNAIAMFKDARAAGMGKAEAFSWSIANAVAIIGGGFAGRATANSLIDSYNLRNSDNGTFQQKESHREWQKVGEHTETEKVYNQDGLINMDRIAHSWGNQETLDNWTKMVEAYNAQTGSHIDPNTSYVVAADAGMQTPDNNALHVDGGGVVHSGGRHTILTPQWAAENNVSMEDIATVKHMGFDGVITPQEAAAYERILQHINIDNSADYFANRAYHGDGVLPQNDTYKATDLQHHDDTNVGDRVFTSWHDGTPMVETKTNVIEDFDWVNVDNMKPIHIDGMNMLGVNMPRSKKSVLKDRAGALLDKIYENREEPVPPIPEPPVPEPPVPPMPEPLKALPPHIDIPKPIPPRPVPPKPIPPRPEPPKPLPPHIEVEGPKYLRITVEQADALNYGTPEEVAKLRGELGIKSDHEMWNAQYWAYRKQDLALAKAKLKTLLKTDGKDQEISAIRDKIMEYESEIPNESDFYDHPYLLVTLPQMHAYYANEESNIPRTENQLKGDVEGSKREKLKSKKKNFKQKPNTVKNQLGDPSISILHEGLYWTCRKELQELESKRRLNKEDERKIEKLKRRILFLNGLMIGSREEIPEESLFYEPTSVRFDPKSGKKVPVESIADMFRGGIHTINQQTNLVDDLGKEGR